MSMKKKKSSVEFTELSLVLFAQIFVYHFCQIGITLFVLCVNIFAVTAVHKAEGNLFFVTEMLQGCAEKLHLFGTAFHIVVGDNQLHRRIFFVNSHIIEGCGFVDNTPSCVNPLFAEHVEVCGGLTCIVTEACQICWLDSV